MGFWNFLGEFALFNAVCDLFTGKKQPSKHSRKRRENEWNNRTVEKNHYYDEHYSATSSDVDDFDDMCDELDDVMHDEDW